MIVPLSSPNDPDVTTWATCCNGCRDQHPAGQALRDWLISDDEMDVHFCPACVRVLAAVLIEEWADGAPAVCRRRVRWWRKLLAALARA